MRVAFDVQGSTNAAALVLLNSVGTDRRIWDAALADLSARFRVIRIDARGHGAAPPAPSSALTIDELAGDVHEVLDRLELPRAHLAGVSLGGMTALRLAGLAPERVDRLVVICSSACPGNPERWHARAAAVRSGGLDPIADSVVARWVTTAFAAERPEVVSWLRQAFVQSDADSYAQCCDLLATLDLRGELARISTPTLVIEGNQDQALPQPHSATIAAGIRGARLHTVSPAAHIPTVELPHTMARLIRDHLEAGPART